VWQHRRTGPGQARSEPEGNDEHARDRCAYDNRENRLTRLEAEAHE
jgi:hypothetical protein